jgi:hypothetical protein
MRITREEVIATTRVVTGFVQVLDKLSLLDDNNKEAYKAINLPWYASWTLRIKQST